MLSITDYIATNNEVLSWVDKTYTSQVSAGTDYITTDAAVASKYATTVITDGLQSEIGANTTAITTLQNELVTLGIAQLVNGVFSFVDNVVSSSILSAQIATCFKLGGIQTFTSNITSANDNYTFFGSVPSKYA